MSVSVLPNASGTNSWIADHDTAGPALAADMATVSSALDEVLAAELLGAQIAMGCTVEDLLLAALGRTVARTIGEGMLTVDVASPPGPGGRLVGVPCVARRGLSGAELLAAARRGAGGVRAAADVGFGYGECADAGASAHPLVLRVHRDTETTMRLHWQFDTRGFDPCTVEELAEQFPLALIEVTSG
ncbi:polyketide synthase [Mycolicibacterium sp. HK-90]|uniref:polyketide synthase n=1 Tax=Mycolicibacterium sp. HK-90 TaxID=3056937 RepID=UPI0026596DC3|nr:polyketide synthase [Mycolicibacterium sp. HK-90]WKG06279.1 polyketide synthase [Mycolicibacterium sp. HK-90]